METVTIRHQDQYAMPKVCCACGEPSGSGKLMASGSSGGGSRFVNFSFPLCDRCAQLAKIVNRRRRGARWVGLGVVLVLAIVAVVVSNASETISDVSFFTLLSGLIIIAPFALLGVWIAQWVASNAGLNRDVRRAFKRVSKAVKIKRYDIPTWEKGYITFAFVDEQFADHFQEMNTGVVLPGKLGETEPE